MSLTDLSELAAKVETREDLAEFIHALARDLDEHPGDWENPDLPGFLGAMGHWVAVMHNAYANMGRSMPDPPSWRTFAEMLLAARIYE